MCYCYHDVFILGILVSSPFFFFLRCFQNFRKLWPVYTLKFLISCKFKMPRPWTTFIVNSDQLILKASAKPWCDQFDWNWEIQNSGVFYSSSNDRNNSKNSYFKIITPQEKVSRNYYSLHAINFFFRLLSAYAEASSDEYFINDIFTSITVIMLCVFHVIFVQILFPSRALAIVSYIQSVFTPYTMWFNGKILTVTSTLSSLYSKSNLTVMSLHHHIYMR